MSDGTPVTSRTLLERVRDRGDQEAWERFFALYAPLLEGYARGHGLTLGDAEEVRDNCLAIVAKKLPDFAYDSSRGSFKGWLYRLAKGCVVDRLRRPHARRAETGELVSIADPSPTPDELWERGWRHQHLRHALEQVRERESERTFQVFELLLFEELSVPEVEARLGINSNQVYKAKCRVLSRVREILERLGTDVPLP